MENIGLIVALVVGGLLLIVAEVCTPSFGMLAVGAVTCFIFAVYQTFVSFDSPAYGFGLLVGLLVGLPFYLAFMIRVFPHTPVGKCLMLRKREPDTGAAVPDAKEQATLLGKTGQAKSILRPSGIVAIDGKRYSASAESGYVAAGTTVTVVRATGMNVIVRPVAPGDPLPDKGARPAGAAGGDTAGEGR